MSDNTTPLLSARDLSVRFGGVLAVNNVSFDVRKGEVFTLIGPNGAGKTTLFKMLVGEEKPDDGEIKVGETVKVSYVEQSRDSLRDDWAVWQAMADGKQNFDLIPEHLVIARYFAKEQAQVDALEAERDAVTLELEELIEEHGADDGPLDEAKNESLAASVRAGLDYDPLSRTAFHGAPSC